MHFMYTFIDKRYHIFNKSQQHRCSKGIMDVSHNIVTASICFHGCLYCVPKLQNILCGLPINHLFYTFTTFQGSICTLLWAPENTILANHNKYNKILQNLHLYNFIKQIKLTFSEYFFNGHSTVYNQSENVSHLLIHSQNNGQNCTYFQSCSGNCMGV